jgi:hypothetical protein
VDLHHLMIRMVDLHHLIIRKAENLPQDFALG